MLQLGGSNVSIAGTLTYEDVTNIDSVGIVTARTGVEVTANGLVVVLVLVHLLLTYRLLIRLFILEILILQLDSHQQTQSPQKLLELKDFA